MDIGMALLITVLNRKTPKLGIGLSATLRLGNLSTSKKMVLLLMALQKKKMAGDHRLMVRAPSNNTYPIQNVLKPGMALVVSRGIYKHFAIYIGKNDYGQDCVLHYNDNSACRKGRVEPSTLEQFASGCAWGIKYYEDIEYTDEVCHTSLKKAFACLGEERYHPIFNNCEHLTSWCVIGIRRSEQVEKLIEQLLPHIEEAAERGWKTIKDSFKKHPIFSAAVCATGGALLIATYMGNTSRNQIG